MFFLVFTEEAALTVLQEKTLRLREVNNMAKVTVTQLMGGSPW